MCIRDRYYLLLHYWMGWFGTGDNIAVRALSGVISMATLPPFYALARRTIGRRAAVAAVLLLASSPFALRYATETRMYALVGLLTTLAGLALTRVLDDDRRTAWSVLALTTSCGLLLLTHYWGLYGVAALGLWQLTAALRRRQRRHWFALGAAAASGLFLVPWLPSFRYQLQHTGTPWGGGASLADFINTIFGWAGRGDAAGRVLTLAVLALLLLGVCGRAGADRQIVLDLRGQRPGRGLAGLFLGILALPIAAGILANQAFSLRYTMVAFVPFLLVLAVGIQCFAAPARRHGVLALVVVLGLLNGLAQTHDSRTQAGRFAKLLAAQAEPGDVVAFCPDQLGPAVHRLLPGVGAHVCRRAEPARRRTSGLADLGGRLQDRHPAVPHAAGQPDRASPPPSGRARPQQQLRARPARRLPTVSRRRSSAAAAALLVVALGTGCGGSAGPPGQEPAVPATAPALTATPAGTVVDVPRLAGGLVADQRTGLVVVGTHDPGRLLLLDGRTGAVVSRLPLQGNPGQLALAAAGGPLLVPTQDADGLLQIALPSGDLVSRTPAGALAVLRN